MRSGKWDVVLLDWWLPGPDGLTLLRRFRQAGHDTRCSSSPPATPFPTWSAAWTAVLTITCASLSYYEELLARVRVLGRRRSTEKSSVLAHGDVRLDLTTQRAERAGQRLELTAKEQALLMFFLRHPGEVLVTNENL